MHSPKVNVVFHRGAKEIGGNCIEIESQGIRILLDIGKPLVKDGQSAPDMSGVIQKGSQYDAVFISHAHSDHFGLLAHLDSNTPIYCSQATFDLLAIHYRWREKSRLPVNSFHTFQTEQVVKIRNPNHRAEMEVIPFLVDHSAFDAHGFVVRANGKVLVYSGDFRNHGRKGNIYRRVLSLLDDRPVDLLMMEGTNLGRPAQYVQSEWSVEKRLCTSFQQTAGLIGVTFSMQNVDRFVSVYCAALQSKRKLVIDLYSAVVLEAVSRYTPIPGPTAANIEVWLPANQYVAPAWSTAHLRKKIRPTAQLLDEIRQTPGKYVVLVRDSMMHELRSVRFSVHIYSLWRGYADSPKTESMRHVMQQTGCRWEFIHTSGHATRACILQFLKDVPARNLRIIHSEGVHADYANLLALYSDFAWRGETFSC